ncbi:hypothetical protein F4861DRAFT_203453 [Xylaria intraflava]|nr:hypothetical protein F4861DRAFT_203453 [Xylaria intraflava]
MRASSIAYGYRALSALAVVLLWGVYTLNGGLKANFLAPWTGKLNEDTPLRTNYTGIFILDYLLNLLITFFYYTTNGSDEGAQLLAFEGYSTLQSSFLWLYAEMIRPGNKPWSIARPIVFVALCQMLGGAVSLPLYYAYHMVWVDSAKILRVRDLNAATALPFSFLLGAVLPAILGLAPTWEGPDSRSPEVHQKYLAILQLDPIWIALTQAIVTNALGRTRPGSGVDPCRAAHGWTRSSYLLAAASSAIAHLYTAARILASTDERTNLLRMRVPSPLDGPTGGLPDILARRSILFLQFDIPILDVASLAWVFFLLSRTTNGPRMSASKLALMLLIGYVTIGAGATVSLALYVREGTLPEKDES